VGTTDQGAHGGEAGGSTASTSIARRCCGYELSNEWTGVAKAVELAASGSVEHAGKVGNGHVYDGVVEASAAVPAGIEDDNENDGLHAGVAEMGAKDEVVPEAGSMNNGNGGGGKDAEGGGGGGGDGVAGGDGVRGEVGGDERVMAGWTCG